MESRTPAPRVVHALPGRLRVHVAALRSADPREAEARLAAAAGIRRVRANAHTGNLLIEFDPARVDQACVVALAGAAVSPSATARHTSAGSGIQRPDARDGTEAGRSPAATVGRLLTVTATVVLELARRREAEHGGPGRPVPGPSGSRALLLTGLEVASLLAGTVGQGRRATPADPWLSLVLVLASVAVRRVVNSPGPAPHPRAAR